MARSYESARGKGCSPAAVPARNGPSPGRDQQFESTSLQRRVGCEPSRMNDSRQYISPLELAVTARFRGQEAREANRGHVSLDQLKVMSAIERCRTVALGGHVARCEDCAHTVIAYNSCLMGKFRNGELASA